eukprot:363865-Chlamydomonas_euryale.AAC.10
MRSNRRKTSSLVTSAVLSFSCSVPSLSRFSGTRTFSSESASPASGTALKTCASGEPPAASTYLEWSISCDEVGRVGVESGPAMPCRQLRQGRRPMGSTAGNAPLRSAHRNIARQREKLRGKLSGAPCPG